MNQMHTFEVVAVVQSWFLFLIWTKKPNLNLAVKMLFLLIALWGSYLVVHA